MSSTSKPYLLSGKVALVTGSSRGIGRAVALELARRGASVVVNYAHGKDAAHEAVSEVEALGGKAIALGADVSDPSQTAAMFDRAVAHFGRLDIVVSNSGVESFGHVSEITPEEFDKVFGINTRGQLFVAQQAYKHVAVGGRLILMGSISAQSKQVKNHALYAASKAAVEAFARCLALDFGDKKITVNTIAPGGIKTDMYADAARKYIPGGQALSDDEVDARMASVSPLGRVGTPQDVANVVAFLCAEEGGWMNGQILTIGGGAAV